MIGLAILLAGAAVANGMARWAGVASTPFLLLAGIVLGQAGLLPQAILQESLLLGLTFVLFAIGTELTPRRVRGQLLAALRVGVIQFFVLGAVGAAAALVLGLDLVTAAYLGLALTASSTLVVVRLLQRRRQLFEPFGRLVVGVLLLQDVLVILLIPLLTRLPYGATAVALGFFGTLAFLGLVYGCLRWVTPRLVRLRADGEVLLLAVLTILFLFLAIAHLLALPLAAGAFLAGVALSRFPVGGILRGQLTSVRDFFGALFFLALGGLLAPPDLSSAMQALVLALLVILITPPLVTVVAERAGFAARPAIEAGLLLSQTSELSLVVGLHGLQTGQLTQETFTLIALVTVLTMVLTPRLASDAVVRRLLAIHPLKRPGEVAARPEGHVLLLGCGAGGLPLLETLVATGEEVVVIDDDPEVIANLRRGGVTAFRGDASDPDVLRAARADRARLISSTIRRPRDNERLLDLAPRIPVVVRVFDDEDAAWVAARGATPVVGSQAAAEDFVSWFDARFGARDASAPGRPGTGGSARPPGGEGTRPEKGGP
jgi:Kef-type K+ transport system membrane component KefB